LFFSHLAAFIEAVAWGVRLASEKRRASACSAVVTALPVGVFMTTIPLCEAAPTSTLSTPIPARPMTLSPLAASMTLAVTLEPERMTRASKPGIAAASSASFNPGL
jgi:hypothetical protein